MWLKPCHKPPMTGILCWIYTDDFMLGSFMDFMLDFMLVNDG